MAPSRGSWEETRNPCFARRTACGNGRVLAPVRFFAEQLGAKVAWDGLTWTVDMELRPQDFLPRFAKRHAAGNCRKVCGRGIPDA